MSLLSYRPVGRKLCSFTSRVGRRFQFFCIILKKIEPIQTHNFQSKKTGEKLLLSVASEAEVLHLKKSIRTVFAIKKQFHLLYNKISTKLSDFNRLKPRVTNYKNIIRIVWFWSILASGNLMVVPEKVQKMILSADAFNLKDRTNFHLFS
jgi:hypothetical protein